MIDQGMDGRKAMSWRAFWITAAIFGAVNAALFLYFWSLPIGPTGKGGAEMGRSPPDWHSNTTLAMSLPGALLVMPIACAIDCDSDAAVLLISQVIGTVFWALLAGWLFRSSDASAPTPDAP